MILLNKSFVDVVFVAILPLLLLNFKYSSFKSNVFTYNSNILPDISD